MRAQGQLPPRRTAGFTLVELLVVVGIIGLLIALLLPAMGGARERARTLKCAANQRSVGQAIIGFASANQGRSPGGGSTSNGSVGWSDILDSQFFGQSTILRMSWPKKTDRLYCSALIHWCDNFGSWNGAIRSWILNDYAGAQNQGEKRTLSGSDLPAGYTSYSLGTKLVRFSSPGTKFLMTEAEEGNDYWAGGGALPGSVKLGTGVAPTPYWVGVPRNSSSGIGRLAFRHNKFTQAPFLFVDGHVEILRPSDEVNSTRRYDLNSN